MKGKFIRILLLPLLIFSQELTAQVTAHISGNFYPRHASAERYEITFSQPRPEDQYSPIQFYVYGGRIEDHTTSSYYGNPYLWVVWDNNAVEGYIQVTGWAQGERYIYFGEPLNPGQITSPYPYYNTNNTHLVVNTTPAQEGTCNGYYNYIWQTSTDGTTWTDAGYGETFPNYITITNHTYVRRMIDCNGDVKYSNVLNITYKPSSWENRNFIVTTTMKYPGKFTLEDVDRAPLEQKQQMITFYDGLGRPEQQVDRAANPQKKDIITPMAYDSLGRESRKYLPYATQQNTGLFAANAIAAQRAYMSDPTTGKYKEEGDNAFGETIYEGSSLNRPLSVQAPGINWRGSNTGIQQAYDINGPNDNVRIWRIDAADANAVPVSNEVYAPYTLFKKTTTDEDGKKTIEYTNSDNQVILKKQQVGDGSGASHGGWLCTYYVHDDMNRLRFVLPPQAVEQMNDAGNWVVSTDMANGLCFKNVYDDRGRIIEKKIPGADVDYLVYDNRDRLVFSQSGNQRNGRTNVNGYKEWTFYLYDGQNRPTGSGVMVERTGYVYNRSSMQSIVNNPNFQFGERTFSVPSDIYETVTAYNPVPVFAGLPSLILILETNMNTVTRYDETAINQFTELELGYASNFDNIDAATPSKRTRGLATSKSARVLEQANKYLHTTNLYDDKARLLHTTGFNFLGYMTRATHQYDFSGKVRSTSYYEHKPTSNNSDNWIFRIISKMEYDHAGRLTATRKNINRTYQQYNSSPEIVTATGEKLVMQQEYDDLGQLVTKTLAPGYNNPNGNSFLEKLHYEYNIRGWMTGINKGFVNGSTPGSYFGLEIGYDKAGNAGFANPLRNGNVGGTAWKTIGDNTARRFDYSYDFANRLTAAHFNQQNTPGANYTNDKHDFSMPLVQYNANGNITRLEQQGVTFTGIVPMDRLTYEYHDNSNRLKGVAEDAGSDFKLHDFTDKNPGPGSTDYQYDDNGNITQDLNKGITNIKFNMLNLPQEITFNDNRGTVSYVYDGAGNKLQKLITGNRAGVAKISYSGPIVYTDADFTIAQEDGRVRLAKTLTPGGTPAFTFDYFIKDNQGNVRMVLTEELQNDLYPAATMEMAAATNEDRYYNISNRTNRPDELNQAVHIDRYGEKMSRLSALSGEQKIGPSIVLKVMSGDVVLAKSDYYYRDNGTQANTNSLLNDLANNLINMLTGGAAGATAKAQAGVIGANAQLDNVVQSLITQQNGSYDAQKPKAFLSYIVFDEQFQAKAKGTVQVQNSGPLQEPLVRSDIAIQQNGWIYIFVNNESQQPVYFDNFQVTHKRGNLLEENHFYPFGLTMKAISPKALSVLPANRDKYNGKELQNEEFADGTGTEVYDYGARTYDPQIGRWLQVDPLASKMTRLSPYNYAFNNPLRFIDPDGMAPTDIIYVNSAGYITKVVQAAGPHKVMDAAGNVYKFNDPTNKVDLKQLDLMIPQDRYNYDYTGEFPIKLFERFTDQEIKQLWTKIGIEDIKTKVWMASIPPLGGPIQRQLYGANLGLGAFDFLDNMAQESRDAGMAPHSDDGIFRTDYGENTGGFILFDNDNTLYNVHDAGNFLTGMSFNKVGYFWWELEAGAHMNQPFSESTADQQALKTGYYYTDIFLKK